jgi:hypothetical protein
MPERGRREIMRAALARAGGPWRDIALASDPTVGHAYAVVVVRVLREFSDDVLQLTEAGTKQKPR